MEFFEVSAVDQGNAAADQAVVGADGFPQSDNDIWEEVKAHRNRAERKPRSVREKSKIITSLAIATTKMLQIKQF